MARHAKQDSPQTDLSHPFSGAVLRMREEDTLPIIEQYIGQLVNRILFPGFAGAVRGVRLMGLQWDEPNALRGIIELLVEGTCGRKHVAALENALTIIDVSVEARLDAIRWGEGLYAQLLQVAFPSQHWQSFCASFRAGTSMYTDEFRQPTPIVIPEEQELPPTRTQAAPPWIQIR